MFNIQHVLKTGPHRYSLIQKYKPVERCWEFNPVEIGPVGDAFKKTPTGEKKCRRIGCSMCPMDLLGIAKYWEGMKSLTKVY
jgi:hypothetical protein